MSLTIYQKKRQFDKTSEPAGKVAKKSQHRFVVQKHQASHLHYDFRLEMDGVLKSWAVPKGVPEEAGVKRLAVQVEDHPIEYIDFAGTIPAGEYGAGTVEIWDKGTYKVKEGYTKKAFKFDLAGKRLRGEYVLVHTKEKQWLIYKVG